MNRSQPIYIVTEPTQTKMLIPETGPSDGRISTLIKTIARDAMDHPKPYLRGALVPEGGE